MIDEKIGRAGFLKQVFQRTSKAAFQIAENMIEPLHEASATAGKLLGTPLMAVEDLTENPQLLTSSKPPLFIFGTVEDEMVGVSAVCEADGFLLSYIPREDSLYCGACKKKHVLGRMEGRITIDLPSYPLTVIDGQIHLVKL